MKGISDKKAHEKLMQYQKIYALYSTGDFTLDVSGDAEREFMDWLNENDIRIIRNNRTAAPHTGWKEDAQRVPALDTTEG